MVIGSFGLSLPVSQMEQLNGLIKTVLNQAQPTICSDIGNTVQ